MVRLPRGLLAILSSLGGSLACGSESEFTVDVAGDYTVAITNGPSSCPFKDWVEGKETSGVGFAITQDEKALHAVLAGVTGAFFAVAFGSAEFDGSIQNDRLTLTNYGTRSNTSGSCSYTYNATVNGTQTGDAVSGTITYSTQTNGSPDCAAIVCSATQEFSGARPPR